MSHVLPGKAAVMNSRERSIDLLLENSSRVCRLLPVYFYNAIKNEMEGNKSAIFLDRS